MSPFRDRPRRLRLSKAVRDLVAETSIEASSLMLPIFVKEGIKDREPARGLEGYY